MSMAGCSSSGSDANDPVPTSDEPSCLSSFEAAFPDVPFLAAIPAASPLEFPDSPVDLSYPVTACTGFTGQDQVWAVSAADGMVYLFRATAPAGALDVGDLEVVGSVPPAD